MNQNTSGELFILCCLGKGATEVFTNTPNVWFTEPKERELRKFVSDYLMRYAKLPTAEEVTKEFKRKYEYVQGEPLFYREKVRADFILSEFTMKLPMITSGADSDPVATADKMTNLIQSFSDPFAHGSDIQYSENTKERLSAYLNSKAVGGITYISSGDELIDSILYGWKKTDLIAIAGVSSIGKTWVLIKLAIVLDIWMYKVSEGLISFVTKIDLARPILFITNEMGISDVAERFDCVRFNLPYSSFLKGTLLPDELKRYEEGLKFLEKNKSNIILIQGVQTFEEMQALISKYNPIMVFDDAVYLMYSRIREDPSKYSMLSSGLKSIALKNDVPIATTWQLRKYTGKGSKDNISGMEEFPYTIINDIDFGIRLFTDEILKLNKTVGMGFVKARRVPPDQKLAFLMDLHTPATGFISFEEFEQ